MYLYKVFGNHVKPHFPHHSFIVVQYWLVLRPLFNTGVQGCLGNRAPGRRGAMVCVHRDVARSTTGAQKCICFFLEKTSAFDRKMNPAGPRRRSGRGCIGFCRQPWLPLPDWGPTTPARGFFKKKQCVRMAPQVCSKGKGALFPKSQTTFLAQASLDYSTKGHTRQAQPRRDETSCG